MKKKKVHQLLIFLFAIIILAGIFYLLPLRCSNYTECEDTWHKGCNGEWVCLNGGCDYFCYDEIIYASNQTPKYPEKEVIVEDKEEEEKAPPKPKGPPPDEIYSGDMSVHFIDVGMGSSIFIETPKNHTILIDGGSKTTGKDVTRYLMDDLEYNPRDFSPEVLITSVMDPNHVGGMNNIFFNFYSISQVYDNGRDLPYTYFKAYRATADNLFYRKISFDKEIDIDNSMHLYAYIAPEDPEQTDENYYSVVLKLTYLDSSFLFASNCNLECEKTMLEKDVDLSADVMKIAMYGSDEATSDEFLDAVDPKVAVISVDSSEESLPSEGVLNKIKNRDITLLRTDANGNIAITTNGKKYQIKTEKS